MGKQDSLDDSALIDASLNLQAMTDFFKMARALVKWVTGVWAPGRGVRYKSHAPDGPLF